MSEKPRADSTGGKKAHQSRFTPDFFHQCRRRDVAGQLRDYHHQHIFKGLQVGVLGAALLTPLLLPQIGWRGMFVVGIFPAFVAWYLRVHLHEPEIFVQKQTALPKTISLTTRWVAESVNSSR